MFSQDFSEFDKKCMRIALDEAKLAYEEGNYPCGAVLTINGEIVEKAHNLKEVRGDRISHAEMLLYINNSAKIKKAKKEGATITMYTTLEPCLMCFGAAAIHRVDRIVASTPDPYGNMSAIKGDTLGSFYNQNLPKIEYGLFFDETYLLSIDYLQKKNDKDSFELIIILDNLYKEMKIEDK